MALEATAGQGWQQRLQTPAERWEEFLPKETLSVLQTLNQQHGTRFSELKWTVQIREMRNFGRS